MILGPTYTSVERRKPVNIPPPPPMTDWSQKRDNYSFSLFNAGTSSYVKQIKPADHRVITQFRSVSVSSLDSNVEKPISASPRLSHFPNAALETLSRGPCSVFVPREADLVSIPVFSVGFSGSSYNRNFQI